MSKTTSFNATTQNFYAPVNCNDIVDKNDVYDDKELKVDDDTLLFVESRLDRLYPYVCGRDKAEEAISLCCGGTTGGTHGSALKAFRNACTHGQFHTAKKRVDTMIKSRILNSVQQSSNPVLASIHAPKKPIPLSKHQSTVSSRPGSIESTVGTGSYNNHQHMFPRASQSNGIRDQILPMLPPPFSATKPNPQSVFPTHSPYTYRVDPVPHASSYRNHPYRVPIAYRTYPSASNPPVINSQSTHSSQPFSFNPPAPHISQLNDDEQTQFKKIDYFYKITVEGSCRYIHSGAIQDAISPFGKIQIVKKGNGLVECVVNTWGGVDGVSSAHSTDTFVGGVTSLDNGFVFGGQIHFRPVREQYRKLHHWLSMNNFV
eukprot:386875_1